MAVANTKSTAITNADATQPRVYTQSWIEKGQPIVAVGTVEVAAADDNDSVYRFVRIPSSARVHKVEVLSDAITGGTDYNLGLYNPATRLSGVVLTVASVARDNFFADALDLSGGNTVPVEVTFDQIDLADIQKRVWEILGLTADPMVEYDIAMKAVTVGTGAGTISVRVTYVV